MVRIEVNDYVHYLFSTRQEQRNELDFKDSQGHPTTTNLSKILIIN